MGKHFKTGGARKALSIVLTMVMTVSMIPAYVFADDGIKDDQSSVAIEDGIQITYPITGETFEPIPEKMTESEPAKDSEPSMEPVFVENEKTEEPELIPETEQTMDVVPETELSIAPKQDLKEAPVKKPLKDIEPEQMIVPEQIEDTEPKTETKAVIEPVEETETEPEFVTESEKEPETEPEVVAENEKEAETEVETEEVSETEPEEETEQAIVPKQETEAPAEPETESETIAEHEEETETEAEVEIETEVTTEPEKEPEQEVAPEQNEKTEPQTIPETTPNTIAPKSIKSNPTDGNSGAKSPSYEFTEQPKDGSINGSTLTYHVTWKTSFTPVKVEICLPSYPYTTKATLTSDLSANGSYDIPATWGRGEYRIEAYYGSG